MHLLAFTINPPSNALLIVGHYLHVVLENGPLHAPKLVFELHTSIFFCKFVGKQITRRIILSFQSHPDWNAHASSRDRSPARLVTSGFLRSGSHWKKL